MADRAAAAGVKSRLIEVEVENERGTFDLTVHGAPAEFINLPRRKPAELASTVLVAAHARRCHYSAKAQFVC